MLRIDALDRTNEPPRPRSTAFAQRKDAGLRTVGDVGVADGL